MTKLPNLTQAFGWTEPPAGPASARTAIFEAERALLVEPEFERDSLVAIAEEIHAFARRSFEKPESLIRAISANPTNFINGDPLGDFGPLLPSEEMAGQLARIQSALRASQVDTVLSSTNAPYNRDGLIGFALQGPEALGQELLRSGYPSNERWRETQNTIIAARWHSAATSEFAALQRPEWAQHVTPASVSGYHAERLRTLADLDRRLANLTEPTAPTIPPRPLGGITAGLELEVFFLNDVPKKVGQKYIRAALEKLGLEVGPAGWGIKEDATIKKHDFDCVNTHPEITTPVLEGEDAERQIRLGMHALKSLGCSVNKTCGLHANVGHREGLGLSEAKAILLNYATNQTRLDALVPNDRRGVGKYFAPVWTTVAKTRPGAHPELVLGAFEKTVQDCRSVSELTARTGCTGPETSVNLGKLDLGYVEFRQAAGTLDAEVALDWLRIQADIVRAAIHLPEAKAELTYLGPGAELGDGFTEPLRSTRPSQDLATADRQAQELVAATGGMTVAAPD